MMGKAQLWPLLMQLKRDGATTPHILRIQDAVHLAYFQNGSRQTVLLHRLVNNYSDQYRKVVPKKERRVKLAIEKYSRWLKDWERCQCS